MIAMSPETSFEKLQRRLAELACYTFTPRPDQPERYDQQTAAYNSEHEGVTAILGGNGSGCLAAEQHVYDPVRYKSRRVDSIDGPFYVWARDENGNQVIAKAEQPLICGTEDLYEVGLSTGHTIKVTMGHRLLTETGWREIGDILRESHPLQFQQLRDGSRSRIELSGEKSSYLVSAKDGKFAVAKADIRCEVESADFDNCSSVQSFLTLPSEFVQKIGTVLDLFLGLCRKCASNWFRKSSDCQGDYSTCFRRDDEQPQFLLNNAQLSFRKSVDVHECSLSHSPSDDLACEQEHSHLYQRDDHPSKNRFDFRVPLSREVEYASLGLCSQSFDLADTLPLSMSSSTFDSRLKTVQPQFPQGFSRRCTSGSFGRLAKAFCEGFSPLFALMRSESGNRLSSSPAIPPDSLASTARRECRSNVVAMNHRQESLLFRKLCDLANTTTASVLSAIGRFFSAFRSLYHNNSKPAENITYVQFIRKDSYWDFHVPVYENYQMGGVWNHNTTTLGLAKSVKFMCCDQPPPRKDTPFWIIAGSYQQVMGACWKEKLHQQGHLNPNDVDWGRIQWYKPNNDWPFMVPLKPWVGRPGKNWSIYFKSYEQGRAAMQAESIGGFLFVEQFPWGILEEVLRGCREYAFKGNKLIEFTPVDPALSIELRTMEEDGTLPADWAIYRANTRCAMEAGHVTEQWYNTFFGMVPDQMKPVRESGLWGGFEGAIYPEFNSLIHCLPDGYEIPPACHHARAIDFGFSADHAFVCLWGCKNNIGQWCYDGDMEVLTTEGWSRFDQLNGDEVVGTANITSSTPVFEWQSPTHFHRRVYDGEMIVSNGKIGSVQFSVTEDHDMVLKKEFSDHGFVKIKAGEMPLDRNYRIPIRWDANLENDDDELMQVGDITTTRAKFSALVGLIVSEGYIIHTEKVSYVSICQKTMIEEVRKIVQDFGGHWRQYTKSDDCGISEFRLANRKVVESLVAMGLHNPAERKQFPSFMFKWGSSLNHLLLAMEIGDGLHNDPRGQRQYFTISEKLRDQFTALCARLGLPTKVCVQHRDGFLPCWRIYIRKANGAVPGQLTLNRVHKNGFVYCVTVPNGTLIVRQNGGTPFICGNCIYDEYYSTDTLKTVVDHYKEIQVRHPWPMGSHYYGTTWCDHNLDCIRIAGRLPEYAPGFDSMNVSMAHKNVDEGIEYVKMMLKPTINMIPGEPMQPRLKIDRKRCPNLCREMISYRRQRQISTGPNSAAPRDVPVKADDHCVDALRMLLFSEACQSGTTVSTVAHEHSSASRHGVQIQSARLNRRRRH